MADAGRISRLLASLLLLGALVGHAAAALVAIVDEVARTPLERLAVGLAGDAEERLRWTAGPDHDVLAAVRRELPEDAPLFVVGHLGLDEQRAKTPGSVRTKRVYSMLAAFLFPRAVTAIEGELGPEEVLGFRGARTAWVLDMEPGAALPWERTFELAAEGDGFRLWRSKESP